VFATFLVASVVVGTWWWPSSVVLRLGHPPASCATC